METRRAYLGFPRRRGKRAMVSKLPRTSREQGIRNTRKNIPLMLGRLRHPSLFRMQGKEYITLSVLRGYVNRYSTIDVALAYELRYSIANVVGIVFISLLLLVTFGFGIPRS